jgi:hypothetical protein
MRVTAEFRKRHRAPPEADDRSQGQQRPARRVRRPGPSSIGQRLPCESRRCVAPIFYEPVARTWSARAAAANGGPCYCEAMVPELNAWLTIAPDDTMTIRVAQTEMGTSVLRPAQ